MQNILFTVNFLLIFLDVISHASVIRNGDNGVPTEGNFTEIRDEDVELVPFRNCDCNDPQPKFYLSQFKTDFIEALYHCRKHNKSLISIESGEKEKNLYNFLDYFDLQEENIWTSGQDIIQERRFIWASTGIDFSYFNYDFLLEINTKADETRNCVSIESCRKESVNHQAQTLTSAAALKENNQTNQSIKLKYFWKESICKEKYYFVCENVHT